MLITYIRTKHLLTNLTNNMSSLFERNETRRMCGTNTWSSMLHGFVCDCEFSQIIANHFRLYFDLKSWIFIAGFISKIFSTWKKRRKLIFESFMYCIHLNIRNDHIPSRFFVQSNHLAQLKKGHTNLEHDVECIVHKIKTNLIQKVNIW